MSENISNPRQIISDLLTDAVLELFSENKLNLMNMPQNQEMSGEGTFLIALIGLSTDSIRVSLSLLAPQHLLKVSFPMEAMETDDKMLQDWVGELSGRLKQKLIPWDCNLNLGLPTVVQGSGLQIDQPKNSVSSNHQFSTEEDELIEVSLNTLMNEDFGLSEPVEAEDSAEQEEDEVMFF